MNARDRAASGVAEQPTSANGRTGPARQMQDALSIPQAFYNLAERLPHATLYTRAHASEGDLHTSQRRRWSTVTFSEGEARINKLAAFLRGIGVQRGDKVAILSGTRPEWMEADIAILSCGAISVSIYPSLPAHEIAYILYDSGSSVVIAENQEQVQKLRQIAQQQWEMPATEDRPAVREQPAIRQVVTFEETEPGPETTAFDAIMQQTGAGRPDAWKEIGRDELANLVYTSGTTGPPKGVMQTHGNHLANVRQAFASGMLAADSRICLVLPLAHSFAKLLGYLGFLSTAVLCFPAIMDRRSSKAHPVSVAKDMRESEAEIFPVVPRMLEKMRDGVVSASREQNVRGRALRLTLAAAAEHAAARQQGRSPSLKARLLLALASPVRSKLKQQLFGSRFSYCLSGGAKLSADVSWFFNSLGITAMEGYGLTETVVACTVGRVGRTPIGSVGPALASDIELRLLDDGELLVRGPNVAKGYYNRPSATAASWDRDGWFHTGDLGRFDEEQNLYIIGRKKEIIVTSGGKNIAPAEIEGRIKQHPYVSQAVLIGDDRKYCVALISLDAQEAAAVLGERKDADAVANLHENETVFQRLSDHLQKINATLASHETVKKFFIVPEDFTVENGLLTPTLKVKRSAVERRYQAEIDALY